MIDETLTDDPVRAMVLQRIESTVTATPAGLPDGQMMVVWPAFLAELDRRGVGIEDVSGVEGLQLGVLLAVEMLALDEEVMVAVAELLGSDEALVTLLTFAQLVARDLVRVLDRTMEG